APVRHGAAQSPDSIPWRIRPSADTLTLRRVPELEPGGRLGLRVTSLVVVENWSLATERLIAADRAKRNHRALIAQLTATPDSTAAAVAPLPAFIPSPPPPLSPLGEPTYSALSKYADIGLDLHATFTMRFDQLRNLRCTPADLENPVSGCRPGFPTPALDQQ